MIPIEAFRHILRDERLRYVPVILECPAYFPAYEARGLRVSENGSKSRSRASQLDTLEQSRRLLELRFLRNVLECSDEHWFKQRDSVISSWHVERQLLERQIYTVVQEMSLETSDKFAEQRARIRRSMRHARFVQKLRPDLYGYLPPVKLEKREVCLFRKLHKDSDPETVSRTAARRRTLLGLNIDIRSV